MNRIEKFKNFVRQIYELKVDYLAPEKQNKITSNDISEIRKTLGKIFKDAPITTGKSYGLKFQKINETSSDITYKVIFPKDFFNYFLVNYSGNLYGSEHPAYQLSIKPESNKTLTKFKDNFDDTQNIDWIKELSVEEILTDTIKISHEKDLNRTHFPGGIPRELRGIGLGYIIYEEFIKFLGYASSNNSASDLAKKVWSQIITDKDFLPVVFKIQTAEQLFEIVMVFYRGFKGDASKIIFDTIAKIEEEIDKHLLEEPNTKLEIKGIEIDDELLSKYPILKNHLK